MSASRPDAIRALIIGPVELNGATMCQPGWISGSGHVRHQPHQFFLARLGSRELTGDSSAPQHEDASGQVQHFGQLAGNQQDGVAAGGETRRSARGSPPSRRRPRRVSARRGSGSCTAPRATSRARSSAGCRLRVRRPAARWRRSGRAGSGSTPRASARSAGRRMNGPRARRRRTASVAFPRALMESTRPWRLRSSGTRPRPARIAAAGDARRSVLPRTMTRPVAARIETEERLRDLGSARADEPGESDDLAGPERERDVRRTCRTRKVLDAQHLGAGFAPDVLREVVVERAADHHLHERRRDRARAMGRVATWRPSRSTVTVSHSRKISSIRWLT